MNPAENYILNQKEPFQAILLYVRQIIFNSLPEIEEKFKYKLPFYYYNNKPFCFFNISKSNSEVFKKGKFADVVFVKGFELKNFENHLIAGNKRSLMKSIPYFSLEEVHPKILKSILLEASKLY